jgi:hypothetical protein
VNVCPAQIEAIKFFVVGIQVKVESFCQRTKLVVSTPVDESF